MAAAKWQQANGAKKCENGRPTTVRNRQPKKCENERKKVRKRSKRSENRRKSAKPIGMLFGDLFFLPFSSGHILYGIQQWPMKEVSLETLRLLPKHRRKLLVAVCPLIGD